MTRPESIQKQSAGREMWETAMHWVSENRKLIRQIAAPYRHHMAAESTDLIQEANIAAFKALASARKKSKPEQFVPFFRVIFKTNCIKLASGIQTVHCFEVHNLSGPDRGPEPEEPELEEAIETALQSVSKRQREICVWLLEQPKPVSTPALAREFNVTRRHACRLISNSIKRIEDGLR